MRIDFFRFDHVLLIGEGAMHPIAVSRFDFCVSRQYPKNQAQRSSRPLRGTGTPSGKRTRLRCNGSGCSRCSARAARRFELQLPDATMQDDMRR